MNFFDFSKEGFTLSSGNKCNWRLNCEFLPDDWANYAAMVFHIVAPFGAVEGVPTGGLRFAEELSKYITPGHPRTVICDDVMTTGAQIKAQRNGRKDVVGVVLFDTSPGLSWVYSIFKCNIPRGF